MQISFIGVYNRTRSNYKLTHWGLVTPYGDVDLVQQILLSQNQVIFLFMAL